jgi:hypothetical protein
MERLNCFECVLEILAATLWQRRKGNFRLACAMFTSKIVEKDEELHVGRRVGFVDAIVHLPQNNPNVNNTTHRASQR